MGPPESTRKLVTPALVVVICGLLFLSACAGDKGSTNGNTASAFPMTIENCGRKLTFDKAPERVLSIGGEATTLLVAAGAGDKISSLALLNGALLGAAEPVVKGAKQLGNPRNLSREEIVGAKPDLVVSDSSIEQEGAGRDLAAAGIKTLIVSGYCEDAGFPPAGHPSMFDLIYGDIETYGKLFGTQNTATKSVTDLRSRVAAVGKQFGTSGESTAALYMYAGDHPLGAYGNKALVNEQMTILGLKNIFGDVNKRYFEPTVEDVIARNPKQVIALFIPGQSNLPTPESVVYELHRRGELANVDAIRNDAIFPLNYYYTGPGPLAVEGLELLAKQLVKTK